MLLDVLGWLACVVVSTLAETQNGISFNVNEDDCSPSKATLVALEDNDSIRVMRLVANDHVPKNALVAAAWDDALDRYGWSFLHVYQNDNENASKVMVAFASGLLEGMLTARRIHEFEINSGYDHWRKPLRNRNYKRLSQMFRVAHEELLDRTDDTVNGQNHEQNLQQEILRLANLITWQVSGLSAGASFCLALDGAGPVTPSDIYLFSSDGDVDGMIGPSSDRKQEEEGRTNTDDTDAQESRNADRIGRCTAMVRVLTDSGASTVSNLITGHTTWEPFNEMTRVFKTYSFAPSPAMGDSRAKCRTTLMMSSYPGAMTSTDDFVLSSRGLLVTETSLDAPPVLPPARWSIPDFFRPLIASRMAGSGEQWRDVFQGADGLTPRLVGNQWMVVDYNAVSPVVHPVLRGIERHDSSHSPASPVTVGQQRHEAPLLLVIEELPGVGTTAVFDATPELLKQGCWVSANTPAERAQQCSADNKRGTCDASSFAQAHTERTTVLEKEAGNITDIQTMQRALMASSLVHSRLAELSAPSPRLDLVEAEDDRRQLRELAGGVDCKVVDMDMVRSLAVLLHSGPTTADGERPFSWGDEMTDPPHLGLPDTWNFPSIKARAPSKLAAACNVTTLPLAEEA